MSLHILVTIIVRAITMTPTALVDPTTATALDLATPVQIMIMIVPVPVLVLVIPALDPDLDPAPELALVPVPAPVPALALVHNHVPTHVLRLLATTIVNLMIIAIVDEGSSTNPTLGPPRMKIKLTQTFRSSLRRMVTIIFSSQRLLFRGVLAYVRRMCETSSFTITSLPTRCEVF